MKINVKAEFELTMEHVKQYFATLSLIDLQWAIRLAAESITADEIKRIALLRGGIKPDPIEKICEIMRETADRIEKQAKEAREEEEAERHRENQKTADNFNQVMGKDGVNFKGAP